LSTSPILSIHTEDGGMCPDLFETDVSTPGDEVDSGINVIETWWNLGDVCPPGCPAIVIALFLRLFSQNRAEEACCNPDPKSWTTGPWSECYCRCCLRSCLFFMNLSIHKNEVTILLSGNHTGIRTAGILDMQ